MPFTKVVEEENRDLKEQLLTEEADGILSWIIEDAVDWYRHGLGTAARPWRAPAPPIAVQRASS